MYLYCIRFKRTYIGSSLEHSFFVYGETVTEAIKRFCISTGYKNACIISVHLVK